MTSFTARIAAVLVALATALFVVGLHEQPASSDGHADHQQSADQSSPPQPAGYNADDVAFATNMIPHHQQAIDLSALVPDRSTNPEVIKLAADISAAQGPEIETLKVFLVQWNENPDTDTGSGHGGHGAMQGMVDEATMARLASLQGRRVRHAVAAVDDRASRRRHRDGRKPKSPMAKTSTPRAWPDIMTAQQAEIAQMKQMLGGG